MTLSSTQTRARDWLFRQALPLWAQAGVDADGRFVEKLDFDGRPITGLPRRTRVQARQVYVFAEAAVLGWAGRRGRRPARAGRPDPRPAAASGRPVGAGGRRRGRGHRRCARPLRPGLRPLRPGRRPPGAEGRARPAAGLVHPRRHRDADGRPGPRRLAGSPAPRPAASPEPAHAHAGGPAGLAGRRPRSRLRDGGPARAGPVRHPLLRPERRRAGRIFHRRLGDRVRRPRAGDRARPSHGVDLAAGSGPPPWPRRP